MRCKCRKIGPIRIHAKLVWYLCIASKHQLGPPYPPTGTYTCNQMITSVCLPAANNYDPPVGARGCRNIYKLLLLAFKFVNNDGPSYLSDLLKFYIPSQQLRSSSDSRLLRIPSFRLKSSGQRKFSNQASNQASVLWNSLLISFRHSDSTSTFKSALKTHLFPSQ